MKNLIKILFFVLPFNVFAWEGTIDGTTADRIVIKAPKEGDPEPDKKFADGLILENFNKDEGSGGALFSDLSFNFGKDIVFKNNKATSSETIEDPKNPGVMLPVSANGGGAYLATNVIDQITGKVNVFIFGTGTKFLNNEATDAGGGIYVSKANLDLKNVSFVGNKAKNGGALYNAGGIIYIRAGAEFDGNTATDNGGAIYNSSGDLYFITEKSKDINFKTASDSVYLDNGKFVVLGDGKLISNSSLTLNGDDNVDPAKRRAGSSLVLSSYAKFDTVNFNHNSTLVINVYKQDNKLIWGQLDANTLNVSGDAKLKFEIDFGAIKKFENPVDITVINSDKFDSKLDETVTNNLYDITCANGVCSIARNQKSVVNVLETITFDENLINMASVWNDGEDFKETVTGYKVSDALYKLAQNDIQAYKDALYIISPNQGKQIFANTLDRVNELFLNISDKLGSSYAADKVLGEHYEGFWFEGIHGSSSYKTGNKYEDMENERTGIMFGYDGNATLHLRIGIAGAYQLGTTDVYGRKSDNASYDFLLYSQYLVNEKWYVDGIAGFGYNSSKIEKTALGITSNDKLNSTSNSFQISTGYMMGSKTFNLSPEIGSKYTYISIGNYQDSFGQSVKGQGINNSTAFGKLKLNKIFDLGQNLKLTAQIRAGANYDLYMSDASFIVGLENNQTYKVKYDYYDPLSYTYGAELGVKTYEKVKFSVSYDEIIRQDFKDSSVKGNVRIIF